MKPTTNSLKIFSSQEELTQQLQACNHQLREMQERIIALDVRRRLQEEGKLAPTPVTSPTAREKLLKGRPIVAVDGSLNQLQGPAGKKIVLFRVLAQATTGEEVWSTDLQMIGIGTQSSDFCPSAHLAKMELAVAQQALKELRPGVLMLDGTLLHFFQEEEEATKTLIAAAQASNVLLIGIAEEIGTSYLQQEWRDAKGLDDRSLLYGALQKGEGWEFRHDKDLWRMAVRWSTHPQPIAVDGPLMQLPDRDVLLALMNKMTPFQGRGIPYWLDVIDRRVRLTHFLLQTLANTFIDRDLNCRFLQPKRLDRVL